MKNQDTYSYKGWLLSDSLLKRSMAVFGHYLVAGLLFSGVMMAITIVFAIIFGLGSTFLGDTS